MENQKARRSTKTKDTNTKENPVEKPVSSRAQRRQLSKNEDDQPKRTFWVQIRLIPIWLRLVLIALLLVVVSVIGLQFGYSYLGGGNPGDVLKKETWTHILDIMKGKE